MNAHSSHPFFHLRSVHLGNVRKFHELQLQDLSPGLNIIGGPNGIGKSSLARAIRASFLDKHNSNSASDLKPLVGTGGASRVELDFEWQGQTYQLKKNFLAQKRCHLSRGSTTFEGQAAEEHLAELMGYTHSAKGSNVANWGVPGLLWVEQGFQPTEFAARVGFASQRLGSALHAQSSAAAQSGAAQLAATAGDVLIEQLEAELAQYWGKNQQPVGEHAKQHQQLQALQAQLSEQQARVAQYRSHVDELEGLLAQAQAEQDNPPTLAWQRALDEALAQQQQHQALEQQRSQDQQQWQHLQERLAMLAKLLGNREQLVQQLQARAQAVEAAEAALAQASQANTAGRAAVDAALAQREAAQTAWEQASQAKARHDLAQRLAQLQGDAQRLKHTLQEAEQAQRKVQKLVLQSYQFNIHTADLKKLRQLEDAVLAATFKRDALATQLHFELPEGQSLHWHGGAQQGQWHGAGEMWLNQPLTVQLPGGGTLRITPGGTDVAQAAQALDVALAARHAALQALGVESLAQAQAQFEQRQQLLMAQQAEQLLLDSLAPEGLEALRTAHDERMAHMAQLQAQLQALPEVHASVDWAQAQRDWQAAQAATEAAQKAQHAHLQQQALATHQLEAARTEHAAVRKLLEDPQALAQHLAHQEEVLLLQAQSSALQARLDSSAQALQTRNMHFVAQDIARLQATLRSHAEQVRQRQERTVVLRTALQAAGAQGLEESTAALEGQVQQLQARVAHNQQRAAHLHWLLQRLHAKRTAALRRLQAPLQARMCHYLQLLLPGATVELDEQLVPVHVHAQGPVDAAGQRVAGAIAQLSYGTQEQLAIISRLAYADLLREAGHPTLVMLDDALVYSDTQRLAQMKRVLFDAATRHQILLLTCRPQDWQDAGVPVRGLPA